jgi:ubiquinone/menaquinone biosynthesis C-methylase UbiE
MPEMNFVSRFFVNRSASRRAARFYRWIQEEVPIPANAHCLEIGCGAGSLALQFVEGFRPAQYLATDFDSHQVDEARRRVAARYPSSPPPALELRQADMLHLSFDASSFDVVLANVAIHHAGPSHHDFSRIPDALAEFERVLRPGGLLVYGEILHREPIRAWLTAHGFTIERIRRGWRRETVAARKAGGATPGSPS